MLCTKKISYISSKMNEFHEIHTYSQKVYRRQNAERGKNM